MMRCTIVMATAISFMPLVLPAQENAARAERQKHTTELLSLTDQLRATLQAGDYQKASRMVAQLTSGIVRQLQADRPSAQDALAAIEVDASKKDPLGRFAMLSELARSAYAADNLSKAEAYANELLVDAPRFRTSPLYGDAVHTGNQVLGRIALRNGDVTSAKNALLASARTTGSPFISHFGPELKLAQELLAHGESDVVLEYLALCGNFWKNDGGRLDQWASTIRGGAMPDFSSSPRKGLP